MCSSDLPIYLVSHKERERWPDRSGSGRWMWLSSGWADRWPVPCWDRYLFTILAIISGSMVGDHMLRNNCISYST